MLALVERGHNLVNGLALQLGELSDERQNLVRLLLRGGLWRLLTRRLALGGSVGGLGCFRAAAGVLRLLALASVVHSVHLLARIDCEQGARRVLAGVARRKPSHLSVVHALLRDLLPRVCGRRYGLSAPSSPERNLRAKVPPEGILARRLVERRVSPVVRTLRYDLVLEDVAAPQLFAQRLQRRVDVLQRAVRVPAELVHSTLRASHAVLNLGQHVVDASLLVCHKHHLLCNELLVSCLSALSGILAQTLLFVLVNILAGYVHGGKQFAQEKRRPPNGSLPKSP